MPNKSIEDLDFAVLCLKHSPKPNFDEVARELGCTKNAAYHRHYGMMRKLAAGDAGTTTTAPPTPKKRGRKQVKVHEDAVEDDEDIVESPPKKAKGKGKGKGETKVKKIEDIDDDDVDPLQALVEVVKVESEEDAGK